MKTVKMTRKDTILVVILALLVIGVVYYLAYYKPLVEDLESVDLKASQLDEEMAAGASKIGTMNTMQAELDEIFKRPEDEITEIAPYDNAKTVMNFLNGVLSQSTEYKLSFADPQIEESGTVRRNVTLSFSCVDYEAAKAILKNLASWNYRCLLGSVTISGINGGINTVPEEVDPDQTTEPDTEPTSENETESETGNESEAPEAVPANLSVTATMTFFESTNIQ